MAPYIKTNEENEESAYAMLLLYVPWPKEGEQNLFRGEATAVLAFAKMKAANELPMHVLTQIEASKISEEILNDLGDVVYHGDDNMADENDVVSEVSMKDSDADSDCSTVNDATWYNYMNEDEGSFNISCSTTNTLNTSIIAADGAIDVITKKQYQHYQTFIDNQIATFYNNLTEENSITTNTSTNGSTFNSMDETSSIPGKIPVNNEWQREAELQPRLDRLTPDQKRAFDEIMDYVEGRKQTADGSVIQFVTGGAGVGKSEYIKCLIEKIRLHYGKQPGLYGSVVIMGPTGSSAHNIGGFTWQSLLAKGFEVSTNNQNRFLSQEKAQEVYNRIKGVKMIIIDEVSMIGLEALHEISRRFCEAICTSIADPKEREEVNKKPFGGITVVLCGDLYQLGCIKSTPIYATGDLNAAAAAGRKIWCNINLYHEFKTSTRFTQESADTRSVLESFLHGARIGAPTARYLNVMNAQLCYNYEDAYRKSNKKAVWLASTHKEVEFVNNFMYTKLREDRHFCMDILAKHTRNNCPNDHMTSHERERYYAKKIDKAPIVIRLAIGSRVKITDNIASPIGKYEYYHIL